MRMRTYYIHDLNDPLMPEVTQYRADSISLVGTGSLLKFLDDAGKLVAIHNLPSGHSVVVEEV